MGFHHEPVTYVSQVNLKVSDLKHSVTFYKNIIGFKILEQTERTATFTADGKTVLLSIEQPDNVMPKVRRTTGLYHFAILMPNRADLGEILKHLIEMKYPLLGAADHLVSEALYLEDPDGNGIEIYADRAPSEWTWKNNEVVMPSEPLDIESLLAAASDNVWNGLPADTIMGHIHLHVNNLPTNLTFYIEGLGFEVVSRYGNQASFISDGKYHHHIALNIWNGIGAPEAPLESVGLKSYTLKYSNEEKRNKVLSQLKEIGASIEKENDAFITFDPSGNRIRLTI